MSRVLVDSGVSWLGKIPDSWSTCRVKNKFLFHKIIAKEKSVNYDRIALTLNGVIKRDKDDSNGLQPDNYNGYQVVYKDDLIFKLIDLENVNTSRIGKSEYEGITSPAYLVLTDKCNTRYSLYYFLNMWYQEIFNNIGGDGVRSAINKDDLLKVPFIDISIDEQNKIANYLDNQCAKINEIINNNNHEIELLEEYKMKILDTACLKGVDKHEFINVSHYSIDKIPAGWKFQKTLGILNMPITDGPHSTPNLINDGIPFISADAIKDGKIDFSRKRGDISEEDYLEFSKKYIPKLHDIYMIKSGATTGKVGIVETTKKFTIWSPLAVYRVNEKKMNYKYLYYLLQTNFYQKQVQLSWSYGTQQNIGMRILEKLKVLVPPLLEQEKIVKEIDDKFNKLNKSIDYRKQIIEKLEEYKKSLIYECVTGKREV